MTRRDRPEEDEAGTEIRIRPRDKKNVRRQQDGDEDDDHKRGKKVRGARHSPKPATSSNGDRPTERTTTVATTQQRQPQQPPQITSRERPFDKVFVLATELPRPQGKDDMAYKNALRELKEALLAIPREDVTRGLNRIVQRTISETASAQEVDVMYALFSAQGRRWMAHRVVAIRNAVHAIRGSSAEALWDLRHRSYKTQDRDDVPMAQSVPGTPYTAYAWRHEECLDEYLAVLKDHGMEDAVKAMEEHKRMANDGKVKARERREARTEPPADLEG